MKIRMISVPFSEQDLDKALAFYTNILGFQKKTDTPFGNARLLTIVSPEEPEGAEVLLEPNAEYPAMKNLREALVKDGIAIAAFEVESVAREYARLTKLGVRFTMQPTEMGAEIAAVLDDTCDNLIMIYQPARTH